MNETADSSVKLKISVDHSRDQVVLNFKQGNRDFRIETTLTKTRAMIRKIEEAISPTSQLDITL
jgi:hypothetical protein